MRRLLASASAALLLGATLGCHHTAGMCDCGYDQDWCGNSSHTAAPGAKAEPIKAEPIKAMPKAGDPGKEE